MQSQGSSLLEAERQLAIERRDSWAEAETKLTQLRAEGREPSPLGRIGKCPVKGCRYAERRDLAQRYVVKHSRGMAYVGTEIVPNPSYIAPVCPEHGRHLQFKSIESTHSEGVKCDGRCTSARGHKCVCSCDGRNHGTGLGGTR